MLNEKTPRGDYGYLAARKKSRLLYAGIFLVVFLIFYLAGLLIYHTNMNLLTIPAMVTVIPIANYLAAFFAISRFKEGTKEQYDSLADWQNRGMLLSDLVIVDEKGARFLLEFAVVYKNGIVAYCSHEAYKDYQVEVPVNDVMKRRGIPMRLKSYRDWNSFRERLAAIPREEAADSEEQRIDRARQALLSLCL